MVGFENDSSLNGASDLYEKSKNNKIFPGALLDSPLNYPLVLSDM